MKLIAMYGPCLSNPSRQVMRDVPECDVQAYKAAGYVIGSSDAVDDSSESDAVVYTLADSIAQNDGVDVSTKAKQVKAKTTKRK